MSSSNQQFFKLKNSTYYYLRQTDGTLSEQGQFTNKSRYIQCRQNYIQNSLSQFIYENIIILTFSNSFKQDCTLKRLSLNTFMKKEIRIFKIIKKNYFKRIQKISKFKKYKHNKHNFNGNLIYKQNISLLSIYQRALNLWVQGKLNTSYQMQFKLCDHKFME
ncbi:unnamed protein product [Paramecium octaurelia]|uniref:Uncharacterized protein n=1 Tax=Paramecium octaurelia TaxID=43137 RepID=A0A8S1XTK9_PAROT|nr:unnamed protein product [Paramecium octaurelia]